MRNQNHEMWNLKKYKIYVKLMFWDSSLKSKLPLYGWYWYTSVKVLVEKSKAR